MRSVPCLFMVYVFSANVIDQSSIHYSLITFEFGLIVENFLHVRFWRRMVCHNSWCVMPFCKTFCEHLSVLDAFRKHWHLGISARWKHVAGVYGSRSDGPAHDDFVPLHHGSSHSTRGRWPRMHEGTRRLKKSGSRTWVEPGEVTGAGMPSRRLSFGQGPSCIQRLLPKIK